LFGEWVAGLSGRPPTTAHAPHVCVCTFKKYTQRTQKYTQNILKIYPKYPIQANVYLLDELVGDVGHVPVRGRPDHPDHEVAEDLEAAQGVGHLLHCWWVGLVR
jgi:hypothetical protein